MIMSGIPNKWWPPLLCPLALLTLLAGSVFAQQPALGVTTPSPSNNNTYRIRSGDKLSIKFLYHAELDEPAVVVRPDGFITLSIIDEVSAKGLTVAELKAVIEKACSESLLNPVVSINLIEFVAPHIYVGGQVAKPGSYELRAGQTLMQAVILAGGFTREANRKMVLHARPAGEGKLKMTAYNMMQMLSDSATTQEVLLWDGDYVFVQDSKLSKMSRVFEAFRAVIPGIGIGLGY
jgi:polysaccharide export outer membrane protein